MEESVAEGFDDLKSVSVKVGSGTDCEFREEGEGGLDEPDWFWEEKEGALDEPDWFRDARKFGVGEMNSKGHGYHRMWECLFHLIPYDLPK